MHASSFVFIRFNIVFFSQISIDHNVVGEGSDSPEYDTLEEKEVTLDMYTEDTFVTTRDDPLDAALRLHDLQNVKDKQDNTSTDGIVTELDGEALAFTNYTFDQDFESTEI